jgi:rhamnosyltransferase
MGGSLRIGNPRGGPRNPSVVNPGVSVVVPTRNGMSTLPALVRALGNQDDAEPRELIVVDSGSTDGTREYAERVATRVVDVSPGSFDHGTARNLGVEAARAPLVVLTVQDARPVHPEWLSRLLTPLRTDASVAGAFARQQPRPDASAPTRWQLSGWVASRETSRAVRLQPGEFERMLPADRLERCAFDNVSAAIRREVWARCPFEPTPIAEDLRWAKAVLLSGHTLAFAADAVVEHSHDRSAGYEFARTWALHQQLQQLFALRTVPTLPILARSVVTTMRVHHRIGREDGVRLGSSAWRRAMALAVAWPAGQFLGGWTEATGRSRFRPREI